MCLFLFRVVVSDSETNSLYIYTPYLLCSKQHKEEGGISQYVMMMMCSTKVYMYITWKASLFEEDKRDDPPKTNKQTNKQTNDDDDDG